MSPLQRVIISFLVDQMVNLQQFARIFDRMFRSLLTGEVMDEETAEETLTKQPADLSQIIAEIHCGCMRLPQELVDNIMDMLHNDLHALKACSLTCKTMFVSTRHLIHRTLCLSTKNNLLALTEKEVPLYLNKNSYYQLRFLSCMGEHDLLRYIQRVHVAMHHAFTPDSLLPHLHHFQFLDQVHTLTIEEYDAVQWATHFNICFIHFYPTLTSLTLLRPFGHYRLILQFALQFPNLEDLCLEQLRNGPIRDGANVPAVVGRFPPLRGHLRLVGINESALLPMHFPNELQNGMHFQSVELESTYGDHAQQTLNACASTVENLTIVHRGSGFAQLNLLQFRELAVLRRLTLRLTYIQIFPYTFIFLPILTLSSSVFYKFIIELDRLPSRPVGPSVEYRGRWEEIDRFLEQQFVKHGNFELIIRTGKLQDRDPFQTHVKGIFPLLESRGCIHFETSHST